MGDESGEVGRGAQLSSLAYVVHSFCLTFFLYVPHIYDCLSMADGDRDRHTEREREGRQTNQDTMCLWSVLSVDCHTRAIIIAGSHFSYRLNCFIYRLLFTTRPLPRAN